MIRVNLLPIRKSRRAEALRTELTLAGLALLALVLIIAVVQVWTQLSIGEAQAENARLKNKIEEMKAVVTRVEEIEALKADLQKKLQVIKELKANKAGPVRLLDELAQATPEKLQLTSLEEKEGLIKLAGVSVSNEVISQFLSNLEGSEYLREVYLNAIEQKDVDGVKLKSFSVTMRLIVPGTEEEAPEKKKGKAGKAGKEDKAGKAAEGAEEPKDSKTEEKAG